MKPFLISFSGIDGAGKSTQIEKLCRYLRAQGISVRQLIFWDDVVVLPDLRSDFSRRVLASDGRVGSREQPARRRDKNVRNWALLLARSLLYFFDACSLRRAVARSKHENVQVVVFDRYIHDQLAVLPLSSRLVRNYARLLLKIAPPADLSYLLDAIPEIALARKPEYPLAFMHQYRLSYLALQDLGGLRLIAPADIEEMHLAILEALRPQLTSRSASEISSAVLA